jgi:hypothetical protein
MRHYGMFTENGNHVVDAIVTVAKKYNYSWECVFDVLTKLSEVEGFGEATDTAVREYVYEAMEGV